MTTKLEHSNTAPKTFWAILNHLLYNKKIPAIPPLFAVAVLSQITAKDQIFLIKFLFLYAHL